MSSYPALYDYGTGLLHPLSGLSSFTVGRSRDVELPVLDVSCSRQQFRLVFDSGQYFVQPLSKTTPTYCDGRLVEAQLALRHRTLLKAGNCQFCFLERPEGNDPAKAALDLVAGQHTQATQAPTAAVPVRATEQGTVLAAAPVDAGCGAALRGAIPLAGTMLIGREVGRVQVFLNHAHVSRLHAQIEVQGNKATVSDLHSANGTFINGRRIEVPTTIRVGDRIDIGPYSLVFSGSALLPQSREDNVELIGRRLRRSVTDRGTGQAHLLLDDVSLVIRPREFVCVLGPSGAGKSTLLSALSGRVRADEGCVLLNCKDLYANFEALKQDLVVVAQKDALHTSLTPERAAWYTARLRLPPDTSEPEIRAYIDQTLQTVGLGGQRGTRIANLSGGQVKRVCLANELLGKPTLLFLDEVTSGLDEQTDREIMSLFRYLADTGKTVVCVTHSLANVERACHLVVILARGGRLAFVGTPAEALAYFGIERLGDVYDKLSERPAEEWQACFAKGPAFARYVTGRMPPEAGKTEPAFVMPRRFSVRAAEVIRQAFLLTRRNLEILLGEASALLVMLAQALLIAVLLVVLFGDLSRLTNVFEHGRRSLTLFFLLEVSCFWFGCNNSAKEVVKERTIYARERDVNLSIASYYASKLTLLAGLTCLQVFLLWGLVQVFCRPPGPAVLTGLFLVTVAVVGVALGLAISCVAKTEDMAVILVPIVLIPQIILAGVIAPLNGLSKGLAQLAISCYWGNRGLTGLMPEKVIQAANAETYSPGQAYAVLLIHAVVFVVVALVYLFIQDRRGGAYGQTLVGRLRRAADQLSHLAPQSKPPTQ